MNVLLSRLALAACLLGLTAGIAACGDEEPGVDEPAREGLAIEMDGVDYNVFITRQLNPRVTPDEAYVADAELDAGETLYGVFLEACNVSDAPVQTANHFVIKDNQGNDFEPAELVEETEAENPFLYRSQRLDPKECIPEAGSVAQLGPTAGAMIPFRMPLDNTENRPLELEIIGEGDEMLTFELDI